MAAVLNHSARRYLMTAAQNLKGVQIQGPSAVSGLHEGGYKVWKNVSLFVAAPAIVLCGVNCYLSHTEHAHERPEFVKYEYLRRRTKRFPWGDGTKSLFHNPHANALPDGYEEDH